MKNDKTKANYVQIKTLKTFFENNGNWNYYTTMDCEKKSKAVCEYRIKRNKNKNKVLFYIGDKK